MPDTFSQVAGGPHVVRISVGDGSPVGTTASSIRSFFSGTIQWLRGASVTTAPQSKGWLTSSWFASATVRTTEVGNSSAMLSNRDIKVVPSQLTKASIETQGFLFSARDFKAVASSRLFSLFGKPFDPPRQTLLKSLESYRQNSSTSSLEENIKSLNELHTQAVTYLNQTESRKLRQSSSQRTTLNKDIQAARLLLKGIERESAFETQKSLTSSSHYKPGNEQSVQENFGSGAMSSVSLITYKTTDSEAPSSFIFKSVGDERMASVPGKGVGIPEVSTAVANLSGRAVASFKLSELLGLSSCEGSRDLVPKTDFAVHGGKFGSVQLFAEGKALYKEERQEKTRSTDLSESDWSDAILEIVEGTSAYPLDDLLLNSNELAKKEGKIYENGKPINTARAQDLIASKKIVLSEMKPIEVADIDFTQPQLQRELSDAHLFDLLTGQIDRNAGNFIYNQDEEANWHVSLIDNDLSFPDQLTELSGNMSEALQGSPALLKLPRLISKETADKIKSLTKENIEESLAGTGLTAEEIAVTVGRLEGLKTHIRNIENGSVPEGRLILANEWDGDTHTLLMRTEDNYVCRNETNKIVQSGRMTPLSL